MATDPTGAPVPERPSGDASWFRHGCPRLHRPSLIAVTRYRFLDAMGDVVAEGEFAEHVLALAWAEEDADDEDVQRVEYLGPEGDWRWAGPLKG
jgi:hypothetical protein